MTDHMKKKVMVVDDNTDILRLIKDGLEHSDPVFEVTGVSTGKDCLNVLHQGYIPDIIFLDIMMPEISGWDVFTKIKENSRWKMIPIIFITARADPFSKGFARIPAADYIEKPFSINDIKQRVEKYLHR